MAAQTTAAPRTPGAGRPASAGGKKPFRIAGYNGWLVLGGLALAIVAGLYLRNKLGSAAGTTGSTAAPAAGDTSGAGSGGGSSGSPTDLTPVSDLASALNGLIPILSSGFQTPVSSSDTAQGTTTIQPSSNTAPLGNLAPGTPGTGTIFINGVDTGIPDTAANANALATASAAGSFSAPTTHTAATIPQAPTTTATNVQPYGGVVSTKILANGAKLTTYASGRQVEQAPGKTPYVVKA